MWVCLVVFGFLVFGGLAVVRGSLAVCSLGVCTGHLALEVCTGWTPP